MFAGAQLADVMQASMEETLEDAAERLVDACEGGGVPKAWECWALWPMLQMQRELAWRACALALGLLRRPSSMC